MRSRFGTCPSFTVPSLPSSGHRYSHIYPSVLSAPIRRRSPHERPARRQAQRPRWGSSPLPTHPHPRPNRLHRLRRVNQPATSITRALQSTRSPGPASVLVQKRVRSGELRDRLTTCARGASITSLHVRPDRPRSQAYNSPPELLFSSRCRSSGFPILGRGFRSGGHAEVRARSYESPSYVCFFHVVHDHKLYLPLIPLTFTRDPPSNLKGGGGGLEGVPHCSCCVLVRAGEEVEVDSVADLKRVLREEGNRKHLCLRPRRCRIPDGQERSDIQRDVDGRVFQDCEHDLRDRGGKVRICHAFLRPSYLL